MALYMCYIILILYSFNHTPIASDLRRIADEIDKSYGPMFEDLVKQAVKDKIIYDVRSGYQHFVNITSR